MVENDPRKTIRFRAREVGMKTFLIQNGKGRIFIAGHERQEERQHCKALEQTPISPPTEHALIFLRGEKFPPGTDGKFTEQLQARSLTPTRCPSSDQNQTPTGCPRVLRNRSTRVRTPVALLRSLSDKYPWEKYEPPYPSWYGLNSTINILLEVWH